MATDTLTQDWITGEEYNRERRRLLDAGCSEDGPEFQALFERIEKRNRELFDRFGKPLLTDHLGEWVAIGLSGEILLGTDRFELKAQARQHFGIGNYYLTLLGGSGAIQWRTSRMGLV